MKKTGDPALEAFEKRSSPEALEKFMAEQDARAGRKEPKPKKKTRNAGRQKEMWGKSSRLGDIE